VVVAFESLPRLPRNVNTALACASAALLALTASPLLSFICFKEESQLGEMLSWKQCERTEKNEREDTHEREREKKDEKRTLSAALDATGSSTRHSKASTFSLVSFLFI
jgi:hypothetical protein